jgi:hypothetical protein
MVPAGAENVKVVPEVHLTLIEPGVAPAKEAVSIVPAVLRGSMVPKAMSVTLVAVQTASTVADTVKSAEVVKASALPVVRVPTRVRASAASFIFFIVASLFLLIE